MKKCFILAEMFFIKQNIKLKHRLPTYKINDSPMDM